jgi:hypothetical protein
VQAPVREEKQSAEAKPSPHTDDEPTKDHLHKAAGAVVAVAKYQCEALLAACKFSKRLQATLQSCI